MFITENFMLESHVARQLYHFRAAQQPIIDYHNHLSPKEIAQNLNPRSITELWLGGDHYKWRAMRAVGIDERLITGEATDYEKFEAWAVTVPHTMRNPLFHWTHLELKRYFGIDDILKRETAHCIFDECNHQIAEGGFGACDLLRRMNVEVVCTTDDPLDTLEYHGVHGGVKVLPTWRPDKVVNIEHRDTFAGYISSLGATTFREILDRLTQRQQHFIEKGCKVSDHGLDTIYAENYTNNEIETIVSKFIAGYELSPHEIAQYKSAIIFELCKMNATAGWVQQLHLGPLRNNNSRLFRQLGADIGCDSIGDKPVAASLNRLFDKLDQNGLLAKTIVYNLNPKDTEAILSSLYNFNDSSSFGKMQYGSAWWFLDQTDGMRKQIEALSSFGLLSTFIGMLTDSRSFISFVRHEYFRRLLCNIIADDVEKGLLPGSEMEVIGDMVERICYANVKNYLKL